MQKTSIEQTEDIEDIKDIIQTEVEQSSMSTQSLNNTSVKDLSDKKFEACVRNIIEENFQLSPINNSILLENKQFTIFKMELFERTSKKFILSSHFLSGAKFYYLKKDKEYFVVKSDDLSKLFYRYCFDKENKKTNTYRGIEESQLIGKDSVKFFLEKDEKDTQQGQKEEDKETFIDAIKFNLISKQTVTFLGNNNNIPNNYLDGYRAKGLLLSHKNQPYALCLEKEKKNNPGCGVIHYPMENYYVKLIRIDCQFDGSYKNNEKNINLNDFHCDIIFSNFNEIPKASNILFEIKNGKTGENKVIKQGCKYQENARFLLKEESFYHIIIVRSKILGNALRNKIKSIEKKKMVNFAILCLNDELKICDKKIENLSITCKSSSNMSCSHDSRESYEKINEQNDQKETEEEKIQKEKKQKKGQIFPKNQKEEKTKKSKKEKKKENNQKRQKENSNYEYVNEQSTDIGKQISTMMEMMKNMQRQINNLEIKMQEINEK